ncbi:MAG: hypothetical protein CO158_06295 [Piscirickettsiaceae bacterium CG_4_9_14_3_um_filter_43_564]|nr:hypothetical protein [Thiomicrospira sp.]PIQ02867.1 MAG: hypothetical protein COW74_09440 [Piscirickettsiaceae bacterium CG18_big_fil_WC_8_21_14_2_50_44_103]PIU39144.1 MAG: hypothetical protein COT01_03075 [Piscirickettsiaceae bacterium CG07_land_8_20_14_0_80_44_28]PIW58629.1 MAG: hypothetical protein COW14_00475 [Piscirickettsiaceae bacterium CG12_big_fil_rev_8_21_14_0_65_44_934]PIW76875.1 MAG: hypothetical protein CO000_10015 [Piscirickettsiaceae bacterium CG_4_8_14_3_um_filter_44_38]PIX8
MDIFQKLFLYLGAAIAACFLLVVLIVLGTAENGQLSVEGLQHLSEPLRSFYAFFQWFVYIWLASGLVLLLRFLKRILGR